MVRRTKAEAEDTRVALLDAAERVFSDKGVTSTSLNEVAAAAGVTRGALYHHFSNKLDLLDALMERIMMPLEEMRRRDDELQGGPCLASIRDRSLTVLRLAVADPHARAVFSILYHKCEYVDGVLPVQRRHLECRSDCALEVTAAFAAAIAAGELPASLCPRKATIGLFSYIDGLVFNWLLDPDYFDLGSDAPFFIDSYLNGLRRAGSKE